MTADRDSRFRVYRHDSRELQERLSKEFDELDGLVDAVITSPPYADLIDYGDQEEQVGKQAYESFLDDIRSILRQCYDIGTEECSLWIVTDTFKKDGRVVRLPFDIADVAENLPELSHCTKDSCGGCLRRDRGTGKWECDDCGEKYSPLDKSWRMEDNIIWDKLRTRPWHQKGRLRNVYEHITFFSKSDSFKYNKDAIRITDTDEFERWWVSYPERYSPKGIVPSNVWEYPIPKQGQWGPKVSFHPSPFPEGLVARIIKLTTDPGDVVFDPFAGIGTTLAIAEALGRKPLGFELNQDYIDYYEKHVRPTALREVGTEQDTLYDEQVVLQGQIYTLRIQKYAYKLYKHLVNSDKKPIREGQIEFIHVTADPREFEADHYPNAEIQFVCDDSDMYDDVSLDDAMKEMLSEDKGSGDYYGVEFHPQFTTVSEYLSGGIRNENLYLYTDGNHNWSHQEFSREEWHSIVSSSDWLRYWSKSWPPLVSSLSIQVENPVNDERHEEIGYQSEFGSFQNGPT